MERARVEVLLRLGDSALILSQRLVAWCGHGPITEEDMALSNVGLDLLGQTRLWYAYAAELEGLGRTEDQIAFLRDAPEWRNLLLVELPNGHYGQTMMRQFLFDTWHYFFLEALCRSSDARMAEIAEKSLKEVTYHVRRSADMVIRLGDGSAQSHEKMQGSADALWAYTGEFFDEDDAEKALAAEGVIPHANEIEAAWTKHVAEVFEEATLAVPKKAWMQRGGKQGRHSEHLGFILSEMQYLQRAYPGAQW